MSGPGTGLGTRLDDASVVVCCGSGGVGKTTVAASLALDLARRGRRVVVVTIDPARRLADALGLPDGLGPEPERIALDVVATDGGHVDEGDVDEVDAEADGDGELWAMMLDAAAMFAKVVRHHAGDPEQADRIVANRFFQNMASALSGTQEYMASEALHQLHHDGRFDVVVVDTPPSRQALDFLEAPGVLTRFLEHRVFRLMMLPARSGLRIVNAAAQPILRAIGKVVGGDVLADAVAFFQAFAGMEAGFRDRADAVTELLRDPSTRFVLVASPHRDTIGEATWFATQLRHQGLEVSAAVVNRSFPDFGDDVGVAEAAAATATAADDPDLAALWSNLARLRAVAVAEAEEVGPLVETLGADVPVAKVPMLGGDVHDLDGLVTIARAVRRGGRAVGRRADGD